MDCAIDDEGRAWVAWVQTDGTSAQLSAARFASDGGWETAEVIGNDEGGASYVSLAIDGRALASWRKPYDPSVDGDIAAAWFDPQTGWDSAETFSADSEGDSLNPSAALNEAGRAVVVWQQVAGAQGDLWTALFDQ